MSLIMPHIHGFVPVDFCGTKLLDEIISLVTSKRSQKNPRDKVCKCLNLHTYGISATPTKVLTSPVRVHVRGVDLAQ